MKTGTAEQWTDRPLAYTLIQREQGCWIVGEGVGGERLKEINREKKGRGTVEEETRRDEGNEKRESYAGHML